MIANTNESVFVHDEKTNEVKEINFSLIEKALNSVKQNQ